MKTRLILTFIALTVLLSLAVNGVIAAPQEGMKVYVQWAQTKPQDWQLVDSTNYSLLQSTNDPVGDIDAEGNPCGDSMLTVQKGLIYAVNVQGVTFNTCDHYGIEDFDAGVKLTCIMDDPVWYPAGSYRIAKVWTFMPLAFDPKVGKMNTVQSWVIYAESDAIEYYKQFGYEIGKELFYWADFIPPEAQYIRHGIYLSDAGRDEHEAALTMHGWREWVQ